MFETSYKHFLKFLDLKKSKIYKLVNGKFQVFDLNADMALKKRFQIRIVGLFKKFSLFFILILLKRVVKFDGLRKPHILNLI